MRNYAKLCGNKQYAAFPISKSDDMQCIGVMELLIIIDGYGKSVLCCIEMSNSLKAYTGLTCTPPHALECNTVCSYLRGSIIMYGNMMESVRKKLGIPMIQIWAPCLCHTATRGTELFCHLACAARDMATLSYGGVGLTSRLLRFPATFRRRSAAVQEGGCKLESRIRKLDKI